jgi:TetR/AcrR family transcriptional regulator, transcriptional repressor for nem operon
MKETTRQKLIDATFEEIYSHGYQGAALADILKKAGAHKGSMYHYFGSKKGMVLTMLQEKVAVRYYERYGSVLQLSSGYLEAFIEILQKSENRDFKRGCPIANLVQEMSNLDEDFHTMMKSIYDDFREYIKRILDTAIASKEMQECDTRKLALFIVSNIEGALLSAKASGEIADYEDSIEILVSVLRRYKI